MARRFAAILVLLVGSGCSAPSVPEGGDPQPLADAPVRSLDGGVEVLALVTRGGRGVAAALGPHAQGSLDLPVEERRVLEMCGVRIVPFPLAALPAVEAALLEGDRPALRSAQWLAPGPLWVEVIREPGSPEERTIALHDARLRLRPGFLRLLARAWIEPALRTDGDHARYGAAARIDLVPQLVEASSGDPWSRSLRVPVARGLEQQGQVFTRLRAGLRLNPGEAAAIVFERPGVDWAQAAAPPAPEPGAGDGAGSHAPRLGEVRRDEAEAPPSGGPAGGEAQAPAAGPVVFRTPTLGEVLLCDSRSMERDEGAGGDGGQRVVLLLLPRLRDEYRLLPR